MVALDAHGTPEGRCSPLMSRKKPTPFDTSRIGIARREAIRRLDEYGCTVAEQCSAFSVTVSTFHRYAYDVMLRRRPAKVYAPGCLLDKDKYEIPYQKKHEREQAKEPVMPARDALEIATLTLLSSRKTFSVDEIAKALNSSKSAVYRLRKSPTGALSRWKKRHIPSNSYISPVERAREAVRRERRWVSRSKSFQN